MQIILTHEHADAVLGLDDIRVVQPFSPTNDIDPTPIYLTQYAMDRYLILLICVPFYTCYLGKKLHRHSGVGGTLFYDTSFFLCEY